MQLTTISPGYNRLTEGLRNCKENKLRTYVKIENSYEQEYYVNTMFLAQF